MKTYLVKDLMVPLDEYATVAENATLFDAVMALEDAQNSFNRSPYRHRAILVIDANKNVVGKITQCDLLQALEPKYDDIGKRGKLAYTGLTRAFMKSMMANYDLWGKPMQDICRKGSEKKVRDFMYAPSEEEYVEVTASLDKAIHQLVMGRHQCLLVMHNNSVAGVLRLTDVFAAVFQAMKECEI